MGVYIKGMDMPSDCFNCPMYFIQDGICRALGKPEACKNKECPLVEVPEFVKLGNEYCQLVDGWYYIQSDVAFKVNLPVAPLPGKVIKLTPVIVDLDKREEEHEHIN